MSKKKEKKDRYRSKYMDLDFENMTDEEFKQISKKVYKSIAFRSVGGMLLFIVCIILTVLCGRIGWWLL